MKFKSKTALLEHIKELEEAGYLEEEWKIEDGLFGKTRMVKVYKVNTEAVKVD